MSPCPICKDNLSSGSLSVTPCNHLYHKNCLRKWCSISATCPTCRTNIKTKKKQLKFNCLKRVKIDPDELNYNVHHVREVPEVDRVERAVAQHRKCCGLLRLLCLR